LCFFIHSYCNETHEKTSGSTAALVKKYLPQLFQPTLLCAGYESANQGSCKGDSGGPLMVFNTKSSQYFQVGIVTGGVSDCGDKYIPAYYNRLDHPEIADFVQSPGKITSRGIINDIHTLTTKPLLTEVKPIVALLTIAQLTSINPFWANAINISGLLV